MYNIYIMEQYTNRFVVSCEACWLEMFMTMLALHGNVVFARRVL